jgi:uncharacterized membrane protein
MSGERWLWRTILMVNSIGLLMFLWWLVTSHERIFYTQDGVLYLLPVLPFFFVFIFLFRTPPAAHYGDADDDEEDGTEDLAEDLAEERPKE